MKTQIAIFLLVGALLDGRVATAGENFVTTPDGTRLYYVERGSGEDVLVAPMALFLEPFLLEPLSQHRRVVFYDPANRGRSDAAPLESVSLDRQVADLEALRKGLGIEQMALLGWSGLGMEMAVYALRHPERVTRLVQMSPVPPAASIMAAAGDSRQDRIDREALTALEVQFDAGEFDDRPAEFCRRHHALTLPSNFVDPRYVDALPELCHHENEWPANLWGYFGALLPSFGDYDWRPALEELDVPRLVIHGREDGIPLAGARAWVKGYPEARLLVLEGAGHLPYVERRAAVIEAIDTFLAGRWPDGARPLPTDAEGGDPAEDAR